MKGNDQVIACLNSLLADELTAINQYIVHAEMCDNWGYKKLADVIEKRAITEMKHAEKHIARILFLEGRPVVSALNKINIGSDVLAMLNNDHEAEFGAITNYNVGIKLCGDYADFGTREMLEHILTDEEDHIDWIEAQLDEVGHVGIQIYLMEQTD
jgi:bacterioferritin